MGGGGLDLMRGIQPYVGKRRNKYVEKSVEKDTGQ